MNKTIWKLNGATITNKMASNLLQKAIEYHFQEKKKDIPTDKYQKELKELKKFIREHGSTIIRFIDDDCNVHQCTLRMCKTDN